MYISPVAVDDLTGESFLDGWNSGGFIQDGGLIEEGEEDGVEES